MRRIIIENLQEIYYSICMYSDIHQCQNKVNGLRCGKPYTQWIQKVRGLHLKKIVNDGEKFIYLVFCIHFLEHSYKLWNAPSKYSVENLLMAAITFCWVDSTCSKSPWGRDQMSRECVRSNFFFGQEVLNNERGMWWRIVMQWKPLTGGLHLTSYSTSAIQQTLHTSL